MVLLDRESTSSMARGSMRGASEICADCNAPDPRWASLNRGVLICDECCSIHRSLGRHISQVKSLKKGIWPSTQLQCVHQLNNSGANNIWEYALIDPTLNKQHKRKPNPRDQLHPTKADFIRTKYQFLTFTKKNKDEEIGTVKELSKQLHSSVRTNNLETSLRLLSQGADPNFLHPERGNRPIHVASQSGQSLQVELLVIYGADPGALDYNGKTPADYARAENHPDIAHRLVESQYELTDTLANYLCSRKPDHPSGQHFIIPELADSVDVSELAKAARKKLQALTNHLFEELAADVYDEVDRRENEAIWVSTKANTTVNTRQSVPFLPVNPDFSATRNQGRQKLARFNAREFATLIIDILSDAKRRQTGVNHMSNAHMLDGAVRTIKVSSFSDDEPAYDTVASDEDYSSLGDRNSIKEHSLVEPQTIIPTELNPNHGVSDLGDTQEVIVTTPITPKNGTLTPPGSPPKSPNKSPPRDDLELRMSLQQKKEKITALVSINKKLQQEKNTLESQVRKLTKENIELKQALQLSLKQDKTTSPSKSQNTNKLPISQPVTTSHKSANNTSVITMRLQGGKSRPHSMIDTRPKMSLLPVSMASNLTVIHSGSLSRLHNKMDNSKSGGDLIAEAENDSNSLYDNDSLLASSVHSKVFPSYQSISEHTELITKQIQQLLIAAKSQEVDSFVPCSDKITESVDDMIDLFPLELESDEIKTALSKLKSGAMQLCQEAKSSPPELNGQPDLRQKTHLLIQFAYDIAKAAKLLVTHVSLENE